ncbi:MAG: hypothetical protein JW973_07065 [Bacteroidales bacterium]|nr:hypothetical protein [Bacteroidales bacterium]
MRLIISGTILYVICFISGSIYGQHYTVQEFSQHLPAEKNTGDTVFTIETGYLLTGILLKIGEKEDFNGSFLVTGKDTLYFMEGEEGGVEENKKFSNLLTFSMPIQTFLFYPGPIQGDIQFYYINAQKKDEGPKVKPSKKKRLRLCRTRHD